MVNTLILVDTEHTRTYHRRRQQQASKLALEATSKNFRPTKIAEIDMDSKEVRK